MLAFVFVMARHHQELLPADKNPNSNYATLTRINPNQTSLSEADVLQVALFLDFSRSQPTLKTCGIKLGRDSMMEALSHARIGIGF